MIRLSDVIRVPCSFLSAYLRLGIVLMTSDQVLVCSGMRRAARCEVPSRYGVSGVVSASARVHMHTNTSVGLGRYWLIEL